MPAADLLLVSRQSQKAAVRMGYMDKVLVTEDSAIFSLAVTSLASLGFLNQVVALRFCGPAAPAPSLVGRAL